MPPPLPPRVKDGRMMIGKADLGLDLDRLLQAVSDGGPRHVEPDLAHRLAEQVAVLRLVDGLARGADELHAVLLQNPLAHQVEGGIERRLAAHGRQQRVRPLLGDDALHDRPVDRLDVGGVGHLRVGHDGRRIGVHQDDPVPLLAQRLAGLGAGIVELARLSDHDGTGADDEDAVDVGTFRHVTKTAAAQRMRRKMNRPL